MAEQWLKAKMENVLKYITFPYSQSTYIPNFVFPDSFIHSALKSRNYVGTESNKTNISKLYILTRYATTNITHVAIFRNCNQVSRNMY
jgi:hypothetical protein